MADTFYIADTWCAITNPFDTDGRRYCELMARHGSSGADARMYPNPTMPATVAPPPLTASGNSAIPYDTIHDYLIASQQARQRVNTQQWADNTVAGWDSVLPSNGDGPNWLLIGGLVLGTLFVVKRML